MNTWQKIAYQPYKWLFVIPAAVVITAVLGLICIAAGLLFNPDRANFIAVFWSRMCCAIAPIRVRVHGKENYDRHRPYVIVANHQSMVDIPALHGFLGLNIKWIMKKELGRIPVFGMACRHLGCIFVDRKHPDLAINSIQKAKFKLSKKASVLFFAEGTRSRDGRIMPFKKGAFRFAYETGMPILPITIKNSMAILPSDSLDLIPGTVDIVIHPCTRVKEVSGPGIARTIEQTKNTIADAL